MGSNKDMKSEYNPSNLLDDMISWAQGTLSASDTIILFQKLVNNGMAWQLEGEYGRQAVTLIQAGLVSDPERDTP